MRAIPLIMFSSLVASCATLPDGMPDREQEPVRTRAALATIRIENGTAERVTVTYRIAGRAVPEVTIGRVPPGTTAELAPVPAGEPITLTARTDAGARNVLPVRIFEIDEVWTWQMPAGTRFGDDDSTAGGDR
jgi:hypothetical protein